MLADDDLKRALAAWDRQARGGRTVFVGIELAAALAGVGEAFLVDRFEQFVRHLQANDPTRGDPQ